jgi:hypothetical protein
MVILVAVSVTEAPLAVADARFVAVPPAPSGTPAAERR